MNRQTARQERMVVGEVVAEVTYKDVRRLTLRVRSGDGPVQVSAPRRVPPHKVGAFLQAQLPWIQRQRIRHRQRESVPPPAYADGEVIWIWGRRQVIERSDGAPPSVSLVGDRLRLQVAADAAPEECAALVEAWCRARIKEALEPLLAAWARRLDLPPPSFRIRKMKSRWGSCSNRTRTLAFNLELVRRPPACLEYVVVHELVHLIVPPHNTRFYAILDHVLPQWSDVRRELNARPPGTPPMVPADSLPPPL